MNEAPSKTKVSSKIVYQNPWITVREDQTRDLAGNLGVYSYMESRDSCMIVAVDDKERIYLVRGFRYPSQSFGWELPGGGGDGEDLLTASQRELEEETGIIAQSWNKLGEAYVCNGLMTERRCTWRGIYRLADIQSNQMKYLATCASSPAMKSTRLLPKAKSTIARRWLAYNIIIYGKRRTHEF